MGWTVTHIHERWHTKPGGTRSPRWIKKTLQNRLPNELACNGITEMAAVNRYLTAQCLPPSNDRGRVRATEPGTALIL